MRSVLLPLLVLLAAAHAAEFVPPADPLAVYDARRDGGAVGDGIADDTDALQRAIEASVNGQTRILYLPRGTYRITRPLVFRKQSVKTDGSMLGPWIWGQHRDETVIRLADGAEGFGDPAKPLAAIRGQARPDGAKMNADFFDRTLMNLTIDTGRNPGAIGIAFYSNNTGLMQHVVVRGDGAIGVDLGAHDQNGPLLLQDVSIRGFATGISTNRMINSQTLSRIAVEAREVGLLHRGQTLSCEGLHLEAPLPLDSEDGVLALSDSRLQVSAGGGPALRHARSTIYARRLATAGTQRATAGPEGAGADGPTIDEHTAGITTALAAPVATGIGINPAPEPEVAWPTAPEQWLCANDFGAAIGDDVDDAPAIQRAIDAAAAKGLANVYLRGSDRGDPNWYWLRSPVRVHGSVARVMGFGFARVLGGDTMKPEFPAHLGRFVLEDEPGAAPVVVLSHLKSFSPKQSVALEQRARERVLTCRSMEGTLIAHPGTTAFVTNIAGMIQVGAGATVHARQYNTERTPGSGWNTRNEGGTLRIVGMKTEAPGTKLVTLAGGRTEVIGCLNYNTGGQKDETPFFAVADAALSVAGYREINFTNQWWKVPVLASFAGVETRHPGAKWQTWSLLRAGK